MHSTPAGGASRPASRHPGTAGGLPSSSTGASLRACYRRLGLGGHRSLLSLCQFRGSGGRGADRKLDVVRPEVRGRGWYRFGTCLGFSRRSADGQALLPGHSPQALTGTGSVLDVRVRAVRAEVGAGQGSAGRPAKRRGRQGRCGTARRRQVAERAQPEPLQLPRWYPCPDIVAPVAPPPRCRQCCQCCQSCQ